MQHRREGPRPRGGADPGPAGAAGEGRRDASELAGVGPQAVKRRVVPIDSKTIPKYAFP